MVLSFPNRQRRLPEHLIVLLAQGFEAKEAKETQEPELPGPGETTQQLGRYPVASRAFALFLRLWHVLALNLRLSNPTLGPSGVVLS